MIRWFIYFVLKCFVTFISAFTLQNVLAAEGYTIDLPTLITASLLLVVMIKIWTFSYKRDDV